MRGGIKGLAEYTLARVLIQTFGLLPRRLAYPAAKIVAWCGFHLARRQRNAGAHNLHLAFPGSSQSERDRILRGCFQNLGRLLVEFTHFPELNKGNISRHVVHDGLENYLEGLSR